MGKLLDPNIEVDDIIIEKDENDDYGTEQILGEWGVNIPIIKIGEFVLPIGDLEAFSLRVALNCLPTFEMTVNDSDFDIRRALKKDIDKAVIFFGYKHWYVKFNAILNTSFTEVGDVDIELTGRLFVDKIYNTEQFSYKDKTVTNIFEEICKKTSMGLITYDNGDLEKEIDYSFMTNENFIEYFENILQTYTTNLYSVDLFHYIHVADIEKIKTNPIDKYTINWKNGETHDEKELVFKSKNRLTTDENDEDYIFIDYYSIDTNFSDIHLKSSNKYFVSNDVDGDIELPSTDMGAGEKKINTFSGFKNHKFPFYKDIINKKLAGNIIKFKVDSVILELLPFNVIGLELYKYDKDQNTMVLDEEHSGKKIVIAYTLEYQKIDKDSNRMFTVIEAI